MASLYRLVSMDCAPSPNGTPLCRYSSLPSHFMYQSELAIGALASSYSSPSNASLFLHEGGSVSAAATKLPLVCRASVHHPSFNERHVDDIREFEKSLKEAAADRSCRSFGKIRRQSSAPLLDGKKKRAVYASEALDMEKSVVYSELRESSYNWRAPPSFCKPDGSAEKLLTPLPALHFSSAGKLDQQSLRSVSDLCMQTGGDRNGVKDPPMSLRMLKRKLSKANMPAQCDLQCKPRPRESSAPGLPSHGGSDTAQSDPAGDGGSAVSAAFASLVYMLKLVQQYAFFTGCAHLHGSVGADAAAENLHQKWVRQAYAEMLDSFLWLFQQVFFCTPRLMLLTMILLANFTMHSMSKHVALPMMPNGELSTLTTVVYNTDRSSISGFEGAPSFKHQWVQPLSLESQSFGQGIRPSDRTVDSKGESGGILEIEHNGKGSLAGSGLSSSQGNISIHVDEDDVRTRISSSSESLPMVDCSLLQHNVVDAEGISLDQTTKNMLVAPVLAPVLEADNYPCFDRTDLAYQYEISMDPSNPLLLSNYAQFLHVVRHDIGRAEKLYRRAALVDRDADGEVLGRFASFLWVAKGDVVEAESAYRAALAVDPTNAYQAGSYAHFLWNSNAGQAEETYCCSERIVGTAS